MITASGTGMCRERLVARLLDQLQIRARLAQFDQPGMRGRIDGGHPCADLLRPVEQDAGQIARVCPDLDHRLRAAGLEAPEKNLGEVRQRMPPAGGVVLEGVGVDPRRSSRQLRASEIPPH